MDRIDRQIVHCLQRDGRASFELIAAVVEVSAQTVARRYQALRRERVIKVATTPDPRSSAEHTWFVRLVVVPRSVPQVADSLAARGDVSWVSLVAGGGEITCVCRIDPREAARRNLLEMLADASQVLSFSAAAMMRMYMGGNSEWDAFADPLTDDQRRTLSDGRDDQPRAPAGATEIRPDDEPLLAELARDGRAKPAALARTLGWPRSRVTTRLAELFAAGLLHTEVDIATDFLDSRAAAYIWMTVSPALLDQTARVLAAHPETAFAAAVTGPTNLMCAVNCADMEALFGFVTTTIGTLPAVLSTDVTPIVRRIKQAHTRMHRSRLSV
jgi:DNA-binding Lrp family transcriptional regulator